MTPPPAMSVADTLRPTPEPPDSKINRDLLGVMYHRLSPGYLLLLGAAILSVVAAGATWVWQIYIGLGVGGYTHPIFWGAYVQTSWALTGEVRAYDERAGYLRRLVPKSPFRPGGRGSGALDVAARLSWLDLAEDDVDGGRLLALSLGPSWTWNEHVRWLAGWVVGRVSGRPDDGWLVIYQARFELVF